MHKKILARCVRRGKDGTEVNIKPVCVCVCVCVCICWGQQGFSGIGLEQTIYLQCAQGSL